MPNIHLPPKGTQMTAADYCLAASTIAMDLSAAHTNAQPGQTTRQDDILLVSLFVALQQYPVILGRFPQYDAIEPNVRGHVDQVIAGWHNQAAIDMAAVIRIMDTVNRIKIGRPPQQP